MNGRLSQLQHICEKYKKKEKEKQKQKQSIVVRITYHEH